MELFQLEKTNKIIKSNHLRGNKSPCKNQKIRVGTKGAAAANDTFPGAEILRQGSANSKWTKRVCAGEKKKLPKLPKNTSPFADQQLSAGIGRNPKPLRASVLTTVSLRAISESRSSSLLTCWQQLLLLAPKLPGAAPGTPEEEGARVINWEGKGFQNPAPSYQS